VKIGTRKTTGFTEAAYLPVLAAWQEAPQRKGGPRKHNAARAEYNRSAALVIPEALKFPRRNYFCTRGANVQ
jgi:hypothetical protein